MKVAKPSKDGYNNNCEFSIDKKSLNKKLSRRKRFQKLSESPGSHQTCNKNCKFLFYFITN